MDTITAILLLAVVLLYVKWVLIAVIFPFMVADGKYRKHPSLIWKLLRVPYRCIERVCRGGWGRYVLFQVSYIPSLHARRAIYKGLGADIGPKVTIHFKTEIRSPYRLIIGGYNHW